METKRIALALSENERAEMERLMAFAGIKTESEFASIALAMFRWAAGETLYSRCVGSFDKRGQSIEVLELPCLAPFAAAASRLDAKRSSETELQRRKAEDAKTDRPLSEMMAEMHQLGVNRAKSQKDKQNHESLTRVG